MTDADSTTNAHFADLNLPLDGRYQVSEILSARLWARTYLAQDLHRPSQAECIIHHLKTIPIVPNYIGVVRDLFAQEASVLEQLGNHAQIPQLLAWFETEQGFFAVQELIPGQPLSLELKPQQRWQTEAVVELLRDVLTPLAWVHQHGAVHGNLRPENLLRRSQDGKPVLIDFSSMSMLQQALMAVHGLFVPPKEAAQQGYQPLEQIQGLTCAASDVYALGMIAIQAWTGKQPSELRVNPDTVEVLWQEHLPPSSSSLQQQLISVLTTMVQWELPQRYANASQVLLDLPEVKQIVPATAPTFAIRPAIAITSVKKAMASMGASEWTATPDSLDPPVLAEPLDSSELPGVVQLPTAEANLGQDINYPNNPPPPPNWRNLESSNSEPPEAPEAKWSVKTVLASPFIPLGIGGVAVTATVAAVGWSLLNSVDWSGNKSKLWDRITSTSPDSNRRSVRQLTEQWRKDWQKAANNVQQAEVALNRGEWATAKQLVAVMPDIPYWRDRSVALKQQINQQAETNAIDRMQTAFDYAYNRKFTKAIAEIEQIPTGSTIDPLVQAKLREYREKQNIKAWFDLQQAYNRAIVRDFTKALTFLYQIPTGTDAYSIAQQKIVEYKAKEQEKIQSGTKLSNVISDGQQVELKASVEAQSSYALQSDEASLMPHNRSLQALNPGTQLRETRSLIMGRAELKLV